MYEAKRLTAEELKQTLWILEGELRDTEDAGVSLAATKKHIAWQEAEIARLKAELQGRCG